MDIEEIKTLTDLMVENDLSEVMIRDGDKRIVLRRGKTDASQPAVMPQPVSPAQSYVAPLPAAAPGAAVPESDAASPEDEQAVFISSPMVGTFYAAPDPDSPPFVQVGDHVNPDTVICVVEAMKVFNEIKAEVSGTIESIEVENGKPVEFDQPIMKVRIG